MLFKFKLWFFGIFLNFLCFFNNGYSSKILAIVPTASFSHQNAFRPIWRELSKRHQVTLMTTDPMRDRSLTNLTEIDFSFAYEIMKTMNYNQMLMDVGNNYLKLLDFYKAVGAALQDRVFSMPEIVELMTNDNSKLNYDIVLVEYMVPTCLAFAHKLKVPYIGILSLDATFVGHDCFGNPSHPIANPDVFLPFNRDLTYFQRFLSAGFTIISRIGNHLFNTHYDQYVEKYFGPGYPSVSEMYCQAEMLFINVNPILDNVRALVPAVINIGGGLHLNEPKPLPKELQNYLDNSKRGVIYFSLGGTNVQSNLLPESLMNVIKQTLSEVPYDILWKYENNEMPNKPSNVKIIKWAPQQDILRHPNVKLFITQGGLQSLEEAIFNRVPIVGMPFFSDQSNNIDKIVFQKIGVEVDRNNLKKEDFKAAIMEVITNPMYKENAKRVAELSKDQPMSGVEKAVWWTEYVIRHKNAKHLRGVTPEIPFYQYYLLDVIPAYLAIFGAIGYLISKTLCFIKKLLCGKSKRKTKTH